MSFTIIQNYNSNPNLKKTFSIMEITVSGSVPDINNHRRMLSICFPKDGSGMSFTKHSSELFDTFEEAEKELLEETDREHNLIKLWNEVLKEVKKDNKPEYNKDLKYGLYQIQKDINIKTESGSYTKTGEPIMVLKYPTLDEKIKKLKVELKEFYLKIIQPKLFEYELLK